MSSVSATDFSTSSVINSADNVKKCVETKYTVPKKITVNNKNVTSAQYLYLLTNTVKRINASSTKPVTLRSVSYPSSPSESITSGKLTKSQYITLASKINTYINTYGRLPNYTTTSLGKMRYENLIYTYAKILSFYKANKRLPNYVTVSPWVGALEGPKNVLSTIDAIGYKEAQFEDIQGQSSPTVMEKVGYGDCWADSYWLYNKLSAAGIAVRIMTTSSGGILYLHRWVEINIGNGWQTWNYAKYNSQHYGALGTGISVVKTFV